MRILIISAAFPPMPAGEATNAFYLSQHLADRGFDVHVLTSQNNTAISHPQITVHPIMKDWSWPEVPRFIRFLKRCAPDAILLMYLGWIYGDHPMITFAPTFSKKLLPRVPFVTRFENVAGAQPENTSAVARILYRGLRKYFGRGKIDYRFGSLLCDSDRIIFLSDYHREALLKKTLQDITKKSVLIPPPPNMRILPNSNGKAREEGRKILGVEDNHFVIAYIGYFYPKKGIETLLKSFHLVCDRSRSLRLVLIGGSIASQALPPSRALYVAEMVNLAKALEIDDMLIWTGEYRWDNDEVSNYLHASDVCVLPFDDGVHLNNSSFASAASHGLPIITTEHEGLDKAFIHEKNVFLCPPKSPEAMATAIKIVMDNSNLRECLALGALELAQEWFSWEKAIDRTLATFSERNNSIQIPS